MKKRILVLTESMKPFTNNWGSVQRVYHYSLELIKNGFDVDVLCRNQSSLESGNYNIDGINVVSFDSPVGNSNSIITKQSIKRRLVGFIKNNRVFVSIVGWFYRVAYSEPNVFRGHESLKWAKKQKKQIIDYIENGNFSAVIISGPPFGLFYLAPAIKKTGVKVILDYRDPWNLWYGKFSFSKKHEKRAIDKADLVVASTEPLSNEIKKVFKKDAFTVLNGYDANLWTNIKQETNFSLKKTFVISYIGYVLIKNPPRFRDPGVFLKASCIFLSRHKDSILQVIGVGDDLEELSENCLQNLIFKKQVSTSEAIQYTADSDLLVAIHTANDKSGCYIVCGKLYDYLRSGKRILSIGNNASCNRKLVEKTNSGIHVNNNCSDILNAMELEYSRWKKQSVLPSAPGDITMYSRQNQNKMFVYKINETIGENDD